MNAKPVARRLKLIASHFVAIFFTSSFLVTSIFVASVFSVSLFLAPLAYAEEINEGTRIIGTEESPAVLNVLPWQDRELGGNPATGNRQFRSILDDALKPVDRGELQREIDYFNLLKNKQPAAEKSAE